MTLPQPHPPNLPVQLPNLRSLRGCPTYGAFKRGWRKAAKRRAEDGAYWQWSAPPAPQPPQPARSTVWTLAQAKLDAARAKLDAARARKAQAALVRSGHPDQPIRAVWERMLGGQVSLDVAHLVLEQLEPASPAAQAAQDAIDAAIWAHAAEGLVGL